jgi:ribosome-associated heat shock protein Hsp15
VHEDRHMTDSGALRLDKWLWFTRLMKSRSEAARLCESRHVRLDGRVIDRAHASVRVGQVVSFARGSLVLAVQVQILPSRRGPASVTQGHYQILSTSQLQPAPQSSYDQSTLHQQPESGA